MGVILVTGAGGLLGRTVAELLSATDEVHAFAREQLDVSDQPAVAEIVRAVRPSLVVHCAAMTNVDVCEREGERAWAVNADGAGFVAAEAAAVGAEIVAVSTDYVFDGERGGYVETDEPNPIQEYGRAKLGGERQVRDANPRHYIVRSAWIYGPGGHNYLSQLPALVRRGGEVTAITDQRTSPTYAPDLAAAISALAATGRHGTYHVVNAGSASPFEFYAHGLDVLGADVALRGVPHTDIPRPAPRPPDSSLACPAWEAAGLDPLRPWQEAAGAFLSDASTT